MKRRSIIIWGFAHEYHQQSSGSAIASHAFIHAGYAKAFRAMGHDVTWVDDTKEAAQFIKSGDVIFVMDTRSDHVPIRNDCYYITHNCHYEKFHDISVEKRLGLQVYSKDACGEKINLYTSYADTPNGRTLFQPWATDLLPSECTYKPVIPQTKVVNWVGSIWNCEFNRGNAKEMNEFEDALESLDMTMEQHRCLDGKEHVELIRSSVMAPAVQGKWQCEVGYLPCRMWKNVSYGQLAITNNEAMSKILPCVFSDDLEEMVEMTTLVESSVRYLMTEDAMELVKANHTYVNRAQQLLDCLFE